MSLSWGERKWLQNKLREGQEIQEPRVKKHKNVGCKLCLDFVCPAPHLPNICVWGRLSLVFLDDICVCRSVAAGSHDTDISRKREGLPCMGLLCFGEQTWKGDSESVYFPGPRSLVWASAWMAHGLSWSCQLTACVWRGNPRPSFWHRESENAVLHLSPLGMGQAGIWIFVAETQTPPKSRSFYPGLGKSLSAVLSPCCSGSSYWRHWLSGLPPPCIQAF